MAEKTKIFPFKETGRSTETIKLENGEIKIIEIE
jgi:hypothetical protein